jgi:hypothetical protein
VPGGKSPGPSIKNPATYEALKRQGKSKSSAAAISNAALNKGYKKGVHNPAHGAGNAGRKKMGAGCDRCIPAGNSSLGTPSSKSMSKY